MFTAAITHSSMVREPEQRPLQSNENLTHIGRRFLQTVLAIRLTLLRQSNAVISIRSSNWLNSQIGAVGRKLKVLDCLVIQPTTEAGIRNSELATARLEGETLCALVGALIIENGYQAGEEFFRTHFQEGLMNAHWAETAPMKDPKTLLQEVLAKQKLIPEYELISADGPVHRQAFAVRLICNGQVLGEGLGTTKKSAEKAAATEALATLKRFGDGRS